jgi:hypothetical protein
MRSKLTLLTTAAALAFGLTATAVLAEDPRAAKGDAPGAHSDITIVGTDTGNAGGGAGAEQGASGRLTRAARVLLANPQRISVPRLPRPL